MRLALGFAVCFGAFFSSVSTTLGQGPAGAAAPVAVAPASTPTLWSFLGIPQGVKKVQGALTNRKGNHPKTEPKNALKALNDPANLIAENKAIKKAAEVKVAEDLKPQKIKAIKYLTSIGCGCYDKGEEVTNALIASAEDCTEEVRLATMQAIQGAAANKCCGNCGQVCCCNEKMLKKLAEVAYERDSTGCYKEPSKRVRDAAAAALRTCCPNGEPPCIGPEEPNATELPKRDTPVKPLREMGTEGDKKKVPGTMGTEGKSQRDRDIRDRDLDDAGESGTKPNGLIDELEKAKKKVTPAADKDVSSLYRNRNGLSVSLSDNHQSRQVSHQVLVDGSDTEYEQFSNTTALPNPNGGVVISLNAKTRVAHVHFTDRDVDLVRGDELYARTGEKSERGFRGRWHVLSCVRGCVRMVPIEADDAMHLVPGDHVFAGSPPVVVVPAGYKRR